jgi:hypothetical protein
MKLDMVKRMKQFRILKHGKGASVAFPANEVEVGMNKGKFAFAFVCILSLSLNSYAQEKKYDVRCRPTPNSTTASNLKVVGAAGAAVGGVALAGSELQRDHRASQLAQHQRVEAQASRNYINSYLPSNIEILRKAEAIAKSLGLESEFARMMSAKIPANMSFHDFVFSRISMLKSDLIPQLRYSILIPVSADRYRAKGITLERLTDFEDELETLMSDEEYTRRLFSRATIDDQNSVLKSRLKDFNKEMLAIESKAGERSVRDFLAAGRVFAERNPLTKVGLVNQIPLSGVSEEAKLLRSAERIKVRSGVAAGVVLGSAVVGATAYAIQSAEAESLDCPPGQSVPRPAVSTSSEASFPNEDFARPSQE